MKYLFIILLFSGCYTTNIAKKRVSKAHALKPDVTAELCSNFYPVKDSIIKETINIIGENDTIINLLTDTITKNDTTIITIYKNRYINRTDTISRTHIQYRESTSKLKDLNYKIRDLNLLNAKNEAKIKEIRKNRNSWRISLLILIGLYLVKVFINKKII
jgi:DNA-directed RNA polymerase subunit L